MVFEDFKNRLFYKIVTNEFSTLVTMRPKSTSVLPVKHVKDILETNVNLASS